MKIRTWVIYESAVLPEQLERSLFTRYFLVSHIFFANIAKSEEFASPCFYIDILMIQLHGEMTGVKNRIQWVKFFSCL